MYKCTICDGTGMLGGSIKYTCFVCNGEKKTRRQISLQATSKFTANTQNIWLQINNALHSTASSVNIGNQTIPIKTGTNGCRFIRWKNKTFMEQNKAKSSHYAKKAKLGQKITWIMSQDKSKSWGLIIDGKIKHY